MISESSDNQEAVDHLFRHESGKMVAALTKLFGFEQLETAEDIVQDTFIQAFENWKLKGKPDNPVGWLYRVAKNKATDHVRRQQTKRRVDEAIKTAIPIEYSITAHIEQAFYQIKDNQLQLLFGVCHPAIPQEAQVALALKTLGGFSIKEIAKAFLTNKELINKRLFRAKDKIRKEKIKLELPANNSLEDRIESVLKTIYLLFNEGYYSESEEVVIRKDLCLEAMRLALLLHQAPLPDKNDISALLALMCFHTSRFESRMDDLGTLIPWTEQDKSQWNQELINRGIYFLRQFNGSNTSSKYQLEASIAYFQTIEESKEKWEALLGLYRRLHMIHENPLVILNETFVMSKVHGAEEALRFLEGHPTFESYLYYALRGELLCNLEPQKSLIDFKTAMEMAPLEAEKKALRKKIEIIRSSLSNS